MFDIRGLSTDEAQRVIDRASGAAALAIKYTAQEVWGNIRREAPTDHGRLAGSFELEQMSPLAWRIYSNVEYALEVHEGTPPHEIRPKNKKALHWPGARHPVKRVEHPGTKGNPYADRAIDAAYRRLDEFVDMALRESGIA